MSGNASDAPGDSQSDEDDSENSIVLFSLQFPNEKYDRQDRVHGDLVGHRPERAVYRSLERVLMKYPRQFIEDASDKGAAFQEIPVNKWAVKIFTGRQSGEDRPQAKDNKDQH